MATTFTLDVLLKATDLLTGPLRRGAQGIEALNRVAANARGLSELSGRLNRIGKDLQVTGAVTAGSGVGVAAALGLTDVPRQAIVAQHSLRDLGNIAGLTTGQLATAQRELLAMAGVTNQFQSTLTGGLKTLLGKGQPFAAAMGDLPAIGKAATATQSDVEDLAKTAFAVSDNMKVLGQTSRVLDILAQAGKEGSFELKDMARVFPTLTAGLANIGATGLPNVARLAAALQVATKGAGDSGEAANNFANFINKITSPEAVRNFGRMGADLKAEFTAAIEAGEDPILAMLERIQELTGGDQFKLGELFQDVQVQNFLKPMLANLDEYRRIQAAAFGAEGVVDRDFQAMMGTTLEQFKQMKILLTGIAMPKLEGPLRTANELLVRINGSPVLQRLLVGGVAATIATGVGMVVAGSLLRVGAAALTTYGWLYRGAVVLRAGWVAAAPGLATTAANLRQILTLQQLQGAIARRGGFFNLLRFEALRARYAILENLQALRAWSVGQLVAGRSTFFTAAGLRGLAAAAGTRLLGMLRTATAATWAWNASLLANPLTWIAVAIGAAALLIYKYWRPIAGFFKGLWAGLKEGLAPLAPVFRGLAVVFAPIGRAIGAVVGWLGRLFKPVDDVGGAAESMGRRWGRALGGILAFVIGLPVRFVTAGANIVRSLVQGIASMASAPVDTMLAIVGRIRRLLPFSPAKDGPLRDIHRIRLIETIAGAMRPGPMVAAMRTAAAVSMAALPTGAAALGGARPGGASAGAVIQVEFAPQITLGPGAGREQAADFLAAVRPHIPALARMLKNELDVRSRTEA